ncbi:hypothetical protein VF21_05914 [Pseudogymnoascus sp. 05NY08]|nr:hypothetical protein VF21_05914 [Pseudogymnoascus sp. 05NY08]
MPPKSKGKPSKALFKSSSTLKKPRSSTPPSPFSLPPPQLEPLLSQLSQKHIYILSLDASPQHFKKKVFAVPVLTNLAIIAFIAWRISYTLPLYISLATSFARNDTTAPLTLSSILNRFLGFLIDYFHYFLLTWPREFLVGTKHGSPVLWRTNIGFRNSEVIVRRSKAWDVEAIIPNVDIVLENEEPARKLFDEEVRRATSVTAMHEKTGYMLLNGKWDLDWKLMIYATEMIDAKDAVLPDFKTQALVYSPAYGWVTWDENVQGSNKEEEARKKIVLFKDELTLMGKEGLFFRWIELVQYESAREGGFTAERQQETMKKANELFEREGVDFEAFWAKLGGMQGMPGMDME